MPHTRKCSTAFLLRRRQRATEQNTRTWLPTGSREAADWLMAKGWTEWLFWLFIDPLIIGFMIMHLNHYTALYWSLWDAPSRKLIRLPGCPIYYSLVLIVRSIDKWQEIRNPSHVRNQRIFHIFNYSSKLQIPSHCLYKCGWTRLAVVSEITERGVQLLLVSSRGW